MTWTLIRWSCWKGQKGSKPFNFGRDQLSKAEQPAVSVPANVSPVPAAASHKGRKLSFKEQRELDGMPAAIAALEAEQKTIQDALADGTLYGTDNARALQLSVRSAAIDDELLAALERWEVLGKPA